MCKVLSFSDIGTDDALSVTCTISHETLLSNLPHKNPVVAKCLYSLHMMLNQNKDLNTLLSVHRTDRKSSLQVFMWDPLGQCQQSSARTGPDNIWIR